MQRSKILARTIFVFILLAGLIAGIFLSSHASVRAAPQMQAAMSVVISEFRTTGPIGASDEFVEIYNPTAGSISIGGWQLKALTSTGTQATRATIPLGKTLEAGQHFLIANTSYSGTVAPDLTYGIGIIDNGGIAIFDNLGNRIDSVGLNISATNPYTEGTPLAAMTSSSVDRSYQRNSGGCDDTNNNFTDFNSGILISPSNPQNMSSPFTYCAGVSTFTPTDTPSDTPTNTATSTDIPTFTPTSTDTPTSTATETNTPTNTSTSTATPTETATSTPTFTPTAFPPLSVVINEVGWAGTAESSTDEWMELWNPNAYSINLAGWHLRSDDDNINIALNKTISANGYYLLERTDDTTVSDITADKIYTGSLSNSGATLRLLDPSGFMVDSANLNGGEWPAGSTANFESMERLPNTVDSDSSWVTNDGIHRNGIDAKSHPINGTPKHATWEGASVTLTPSSTPTLTSTPTFTPTDTSTPTSSSTPTSTSTAFPTLSLVINEVGWMGTKADANDEWIELHNPGALPINLSGWKLSGASSLDINLAGTIPAKKYFLILDNSSVFQDLNNVAPYRQIAGLSLSNNGKALKLLDPTNTVVDTADNWGGSWPAGSASPNYASMERYYSPGGSIPRDGPAAWVTFAGPTTSTPSDRNGNHVHGTPGQINWATTVTETPSPTATSTPIVCPPATYSSLSLLINEVGWMGTSSTTTDDEWIELYNPGSKCINLSGGGGWVLSGASSSNINLSGTIPADGFFLILDNADVFQNLASFAPNYQVAGLSLSNGGQELQLIGPGDTIIDTADWWGDAWPAGIASSSNSNSAYSSMERIGDVADSPSAWVTFAGPTTNTPLDRNGNHVHGTPGQKNWAWSVTETPSPMPTATLKPTPTIGPTPVPAVVLNEILPRPGSDWNGDGAVNNYDEFIEVENLGPGIADLTSWELEVNPNNGSGSFTLPSLQLNPNERAVFFGSTTQLQLEDSGDTVSLVDTENITEDAFTYPAVTQPDDSWCRIRDGIGFWRDGCFPTPGFENALSGILPAPLTPQPGGEAACLLPDVAPSEFRLAECNGSGADIWNQQYWNDLSGQNEYAVPDPKSKGETYIQ